MKTIKVTCYVTVDNELRTADTNERLRIATRSERIESFDEDDTRDSSHTGAVHVQVPISTLRSHAPLFVEWLIESARLVA